jgi:predicted porin
VGSNLIAPIHLGDRDRDKVRLSVNWTPLDPLTLGFYVDEARDDYSARDGSTIGPMKGKYRNYSFDAAYSFTDQWQANAWYTWNETTAEQTTCVSASSSGVCGSPTWAATLRNKSDNFGVGFRGRPSASFQVGGDLSYSDIKDKYEQAAVIGAPITSLPEITTRLTRLNLFAKYALQKNAGVRIDYIYDRYSTNDWTWSTWMYADGTRLVQDPTQQVNFLGITYYYKWQ